MLKKRIIPCLDIKDGRTVKGINFMGLRDCGDPVELAKSYVLQGCDELVFLDISATIEKRKTLLGLVRRIASEIDIPFTVGGGISRNDDVSALLNAGADKVSINSAALNSPELISVVSKRFGSQCVVVAIDIKSIEGEWYVFKNGGRVNTHKTAMAWAKEVDELGAGEILLTVMDNDGTKDGFALDVTSIINDTVNIPVIASGGGGSIEHFVELFTQTDVSAGLAASIFHFGEVSIKNLKTELLLNKISVRTGR